MQTKQSIEDSLYELKTNCFINHIKELAMPRIGCGLDKKDWNKVKKLIIDIFRDTDITIYVYYL